MQKIKVLMIGSDNSVKGGITSVITQLLNHDWEKEDIKMKFLPSYIDGSKSKRIYFFVKSYLKLLYLILQYKPNLVHIHMSHNASFYRKYLIHKTCKIFNIKNIIHLHSSEFKNFYINGNKKRKIRIKRLLRQSDRIFVLGDAWNKAILKIEPKANTFVLNNSISMPLEVSNRENHSINVLFLGVLVERKGVMDLLKAFSILEKNNTLNSKIKLQIGGTGIEEVKLKHYVERNDLLDYVEFLGWVTGEQKIKLLSRSSIFVLPSYNEGLPISILEAISHGVPIISTNVGSINEAVIENFNGHLYEPGDVEVLANHLKKMVMSKDLRIKFGENSRNLTEEKFSDINYYRIIKHVYKQILN